MAKRFHLGWFTNFTAGNWDHTFSHGGSPWDGRFYVEFAQALERACFDYVIFEDKLLVPEAHRGSAESTLKYGMQVPKHEMREFQRFLTKLGYPYVDESRNPAYRLFLG